MNSDIRELNNEKQSKITLNKYIVSFFEYIKKTVNMFFSMGFKTKLKCIIEQFLILLSLIIGSIGDNMLRGLISMLSDNVYTSLYRIFGSIYLILSTVLGIIILLYVFKIRYLDYYDSSMFETGDKGIEKDIENKKINNNIMDTINEPRKDRIIIRDPKEHEYKFFSGLAKTFIFLIKVFVSFIVFSFCMSLIFFVVCFVLSLMLFKINMFFCGVFISLISCIIINVIILIVLINFIINRKSKKKLCCIHL